MKPDTIKTDVEEESYYVIVLTFRHSRPIPNTRTHEWYDSYQFFKADRYSAYSGRLQTDYDAELARHWTTPEGAQKALASLIAKKTIKRELNPAVCKYTKTITRSYSLAIVPAESHEPANS